MQKTIFALLTNKEARNTKLIEISLDKEFVAGAPWFNDDPVESTK